MSRPKTITALTTTLVATLLIVPSVAMAVDGVLDSGFNSGTAVITDISSDKPDQGNSVTMQTDGKIIVAATSQATNNDFAVLRYNPDGTLDTSFSGDGQITTGFGGSSQDSAFAIAMQSDGKIVAGGTASATVSDFAVARYNTDGTLDTSFSDDGKVTIDFGTNTNDDMYSMALQPDGKILVVGISVSNFAVARYNTDGTLDTSFSGDGKVTTDSGLADYGYSIAVQSDGKIVVAGQSGSNASANFGVVRYNTDGTLDEAFDGESGVNGNGRVSTDIGSGTEDVATSVAVQSDGKIVAAGYSLTSGNTSTSNFVVVRYNANGSLDNTFGSNGRTTTDIGSSTQDLANSMTIQPDGNIVVAGWSGTAGSPTTRNVAVVRYSALPLSAALAASAATSSSASLLFTVTGTGNLDCTTLSTAAGVDFTLTGIASISGITQTNSTTCTIAATSTATAGGGDVTSTLGLATSFAINLTNGNNLRTLAGAPQTVTVTVPNPQSVVEPLPSNTNRPQTTSGDSSTTTTPSSTTTTPSSTTTTPSSLTLRINKVLPARSIAVQAKLKVPSSSKLTLRVATSSRKNCKVSGTSIKGLKTGPCRMTVTATPKTGRSTSKTLTITVSK